MKILELLKGNTRRKTKVLSVSSKLFVLGERSGKGWHTSFLWCGTFGNYLIGLPREVEPFKPLLTAKGGVKAILLVENTENLQKVAEQLFRFTGAYLIAGDYAPSWQIPSSRHHSVYHHDFQTSWLGNDESGRNKWLIKVQGASLLVGESSDAARVGSATEVLVLHRAIQVDDLGQSVSIPRTELSLADFGLSVSQFFKSQRVIHFFAKELPYLAVFDDIEFERNDFEVIGPTARRQLVTVLQDFGASTKAGQVFSKNGQEIALAKPNRVLASHPLDSIDTKSGRLYIVTPTQYWLALVDSDLSEEAKLGIAEDFAAVMPFNWRKVKDSSQKCWQDSQFLTRVKAKQKICVDHYRSRRPRGVLGAIFTAGVSRS